MAWIRTNRRFGAWWALLAIALQIVLSFGHAHRSDEVRLHAAAAAAAYARLAHIDLADTDLPHAVAIERRGPAGPDGSAAFEPCAICAVIELAAAAVPPQPPTWGVPERIGEAGFAIAADAGSAPAQRRLFQARAPPPAA